MAPPLAALLVAACASLVAPAAAQAQDDFFGRDKALHFGASMIIAAGGYGLTATVSDDTGTRLWVGAAAGLGAGLAKEGYDALGYGDPSYKDLVWDVIGVATGLGLAWLIDRALTRDEAASASPVALIPAHPRAPGPALQIRF